MHIKKTLIDFLAEQYKVVNREDFKDSLLDLATLDLEDDQVHYPNMDNRKQTHLFSGSNYDLYLLDRDELPISGSYEINITNNDGDTIGFIRGTKSDNILSFNLIHIKEDYRGSGIGTDIYENFLNDGYIIRSDSEITSDTYSMYDRLAAYGYTPILFDDDRVGLMK